MDVPSANYCSYWLLFQQHATSRQEVFNNTRHFSGIEAGWQKKSVQDSRAEITNTERRKSQGRRMKAHNNKVIITLIYLYIHMHIYSKLCISLQQQIHAFHSRHWRCPCSSSSTSKAPKINQAQPAAIYPANKQARKRFEIFPVTKLSQLRRAHPQHPFLLVFLPLTPCENDGRQLSITLRYRCLPSPGSGASRAFQSGSLQTLTGSGDNRKNTGSAQQMQPEHQK